FFIDRIALGGAVGQHRRQPAQLVQRSIRSNGKWGMPLEQPTQGFQRYTGRRPRRRITRGDLAGVRKAGFECRAGLAIDQGHLGAPPREIPRSRYADDAAADNDYVHGCLHSEAWMLRIVEIWRE